MASNYFYTLTVTFGEKRIFFFNFGGRLFWDIWYPGYSPHTHTEV